MQSVSKTRAPTEIVTQKEAYSALLLIVTLLYVGCCKLVMVRCNG